MPGWTWLFIAAVTLLVGLSLLGSWWRDHYRGR